MSAAPNEPEAPEAPEAPPWTGPWADDARRLFHLFQTATETVGAALAEEATGAGATSSAPGEHPPECRYCPLCQGVALVRRAGPDVLDQLAEFAAELAATLRATQPAADQPSGAASTPATRSPTESPNEPPAEPPTGPLAGTDGSASPGPATGRTSAAARPPSTVRIEVTD